jgi:hypothetical protein
MISTRRPWTRKLAIGLAMVLAGAVLVWVFRLYSRADFLLQLTNQLWSCF